MLIIQNIYNSTPPRTFATDRTGGKETGLTLGEEVQVFVKGDTLYFTHNHRLPDTKGYQKIAVQKVFRTQNRPQITIPAVWAAEYCSEVTHLRAYYTEIGLFLRPFYKG